MVEQELTSLIHRLQIDGASTERLSDWRGNRNLLALMLRTESGACYVVEPSKEGPSLVTRLSETQPYYGEYRLPSTEVIVRRQGNPDKEIMTGRCVNIYGLPRKGIDFDPDSIYTTMPLVEIKYLEREQ